jgi:hypothetical protein
MARSRSLFGHQAEGPAQKTAQMKFRLTGPLQKLIEDAAKQHDWAASEEIRRRLAASFHDNLDADDETTRKLMRGVASAAYYTENFGAWHENPFAFQVFRATVLKLIDLFKPPGEPIRPTGVGADFFLGDDGTPETAGSVFAATAALDAGISLPGHLRRKHEG